jgi:hypothetical protein
MEESRNIYDILSKIEWEGGIDAVLDYGMRNIDEYDVPGELKEQWAEMCDAYAEFETLRDEMDRALSRFEIEYGEKNPTEEY